MSHQTSLRNNEENMVQSAKARCFDEMIGSNETRTYCEQRASGLKSWLVGLG